MEKPNTETEKLKTRILICCCCGREAPAYKQWWNRDTGYGACNRCYEDMVKRSGLKEAIENYGKPGVHHSLKEYDITGI